MNSKLSHRLQTIHQHTPLNPHIYDIGCDHGDLGLSFQLFPEVQSIWLVDPSFQVIERLKNKINVSDIPKAIKIIKKKADQLKIETKKNSIIMCGFGGSQMARGVGHLKDQLDQDSFFILSPHRHLLQLREYLSKGNFDLVADMVIIEDGLFYPLLVVANKTGRGVHPYGGRDLWDSPEGAHYRKHLLQVLKNHKNPRDQGFFKYLETL